MEKHDFYRKYANIPLSKRLEPISIKCRTITIDNIYYRIRGTERKIKAIEKEQDKLLKIAGEYFELTEKKLLVKK